MELSDPVPELEGAYTVKPRRVATRSLIRLLNDHCWPQWRWRRTSTVKAVSDPFVVGGEIWRILLFPAGNHQRHNTNLSLYLQCPRPQLQPRAVFVLSLVNADSSRNLCKEAAFRFTDQTSDWGFVSFATQQEVFAQGSGFLGPSENTLTINVTIKLEPHQPDNPESYLGRWHRAYQDRLPQAGHTTRMESDSITTTDSKPASSKTEDGVPRQYICCIGQSIMMDPVTACDGHTYERRSIRRWMAICDKDGRSCTSPITRDVLQNRTLYPNHAMRSLIDDWHHTHQH